MNTQINNVLEDIRSMLEQDESEVAHGPRVPADVGGETTADAEAGEGGAANPPNVGDALDNYLQSIAATVALEYDKDPKEALAFVFRAADTLAGEGLILPMPGDDASPEEIATWMGKAATTQFAYHVHQRARDMFNK